MSAPPTAGHATARPSGGLSRVLARAALPPVSVPSAPGEPRAVRPGVVAVPSDAVPDRTSERRSPVRPAAPRAVPTEPGRPAIAASDEAVTGDVVGLDDLSPRPTTTAMPRRGVPAAVLVDQGRPVAPAEAGQTPTTPARTSIAPEPAQARPSGVPGAVAQADEPGIKSVRPPTAAAQAPVDPASGRFLPDSVVVTQDPTPATIAEPASPVTRIGPPAAEGPDGTNLPAPPAPPPVVIGRIEVHMDSPAAQQDPFAGCRVVAGGLTARRGGAW